jgi:hypothetical protein
MNMADTKRRFLYRFSPLWRRRTTLLMRPRRPQPHEPGLTANETLEQTDRSSLLRVMREQRDDVNSKNDARNPRVSTRPAFLELPN